MKKSPGLVPLKKQIETTDVTQSLTFLLARRAVIAGYADIEDYVFRAPEPLTRDLKAFEHHFSILRSRFQRVLHANDIFVGSSVVDQLLFGALRDATIADPVKDTLEVIRNTGIHRPGLVLYPLHSFGIAGAGLFEFFEKARVDLHIREAGLALRAQTNSLRTTLEFLTNAMEHLGISRQIPKDALEHYDRMQVLRWLTHNPLLVVKVRTFSGTYYENQSFIVIKLKTATTLIFMLSALQNGLEQKARSWGSTRAINNFETLDIKHYVVFEPRPRSRRLFEARRVPMNVSRAELAELTAVPVDISLRASIQRTQLVKRVCSALQRVEAGYLREGLDMRNKSVSARVYRKLFESLSYFRRSFRLTADPGEAYVNLAVAFEVLLTDNYAKGVDARIKKRLRAALKGADGSRTMNQAAANLYTARSEIVHTGTTAVTVDIAHVRRAFVCAFTSIVERLPRLPASTNEPMKALLGV